MARQGTSSVFRRLFLMFLGLVVVVYGVLMGLFVSYVEKQREVESSGQVTRVTNSASVIEQQILAVNNVKLELLNDTRVSRLAQGLYADNYQKSQLILELLQTIQTTQSINSILSDIVILLPREQIELSAKNGYHRRAYDAAEPTGIGRLVLNGNQPMMRAFFPLTTSLEENYVPDYEIQITLSDRYLTGFLDNFRNRELEGAFWVLDTGENRQLLFSSEPQEASLMSHWDAEWTGAGMPVNYAREHTCPEGEFLFVSQRLETGGLILVTYQNTRAIAWTLGNTLLYMSMIVLGMGLLFGMIVVWANHSVNKPIRRVMDAFEKVRSGDLDVWIYHSKNDEFGYIYDSFNKMVHKIGELIDNIKEQKILLQNAELMQLQSQINPHFLYNSFYNIKFMAHNEDYEQIETFVTALAKYYRFINKETKLEVALSSEAAHMDNYIEIQQMRFGDKITVEREPLPPEVASFRVPKLILQPIIENAYNYGLKDKLEGGLLWVRYRTDGNHLLIEIEDNGGSLTQQKLEDMRAQIQTFEGDALNHALTNINRRLILAYGGSCGMTLDIGSEGGLKVTLRLDTSVRL